MRALSLAMVLAGAALAEDPSHVRASAAVQANYVFGASGGAGPTLGYLQGTNNQFRFTEASLSLTGDWARVGFRIDGGGGGFYDFSMPGDTWKGPNRYVSQAFAYVKPFADFPVRIEAGKFYSSVGAELPQTYQDFNTTRSLLFWYGSPLYHVGIRASAPVTDSVTLGAQLLSGCNTITGAHGHQSMALTAGRTAQRWSVAQLYMGGNEKPAGAGWRQLSDTILQFNPSKSTTGYFEVLAALERRVRPGYDRWYGWATAWKFSPLPKWSISPRAEWYNDPDGATTGLAQRLTEFTLTAEYRPNKHAIARLEYRDEWSNRPFYANGPGGLLSRHAQGLVAGMTLLFDRGLF